MSDYTDKDEQARRAEFIAKYERERRIFKIKKRFRYTVRYSVYTVIALLVIGYVLLRVFARDYNLISKMG